MSAILGIDAAWTLTQPSGVALVRKTSETWECVALAPSYSAFIALGKGIHVGWSDGRSGAAPDVRQLLAASQSICGDAVDVVAVDMPLSRKPIASGIS